jgi:subfamily B ATP-binding cassette protein HlyB/CyaB
MAQTHNREDHHDTGLECLVLVARLHGLAAEVDRLRHEFSVAGRSLDSDTLVRAANYLGLKAKKICSNQQRLARTALPVIARHRDGHYFIIARVNEGKVLLRDPLRSDVQALPVSEFAGLWSGELVLITRRAQQAAAAGHFGFGWFVAAMLRYRSLLVEVLVASFFIQLLALVTPLFFQVVIDKVLVHQGLSTLDVLAAGLLVVSVFEVTLGGLRTYVFSHTTNRIDVELGGRLYRHLLALPLAYFESRRVGDSVARVRELENIRNFITGAALTVVVDLVFTVVFLAVMYFYSPLLTLVVLATFPAYLLLSILVTPVLRARLQEKFNRGAENQAFLVETLSGMETLKASAVEPQSRRRWEEQLAAYVQASFRSANLGNIAGQSAGLINKLMTIMILWCGAHAVISGELSVGQLIAFNMFAARVSAPVLRLVQLWQDFQQASVSVRRLGDILNTPTEPVYDRNRTALPGLKGRIQFDNVSFSYQPQGREILRQLSLEISPGQVVGIVGRSGSGKSTLARLVQRLHVPDSGRVRIDGVDLAMVDVTWLRHQIGVVLQENVLFNRTIRENIALRDPGMPLEQVIRAARLAGAHNFILELSEGYDTLVGEQGSNLSGGQRQRIAIARALVTNPRILIFDEATSALDYESEQAVQENMAAITRGRTVIIIAHRLSALRHVDRVVVVDQGSIVEEGGHESLLKAGRYYADMHARQSGWSNVALDTGT